MRLKIKNNYHLVGYALLFAFLLSSLLTFRAYLLWLQWGKPEAYKWWDQSSAFYLNYMLWACLLPLLRWLAEKYPIGRAKMPKGGVVKLLIISIVLSACHEFTTYILWFIPLDLMGIEEFGASSWEYIFKTAPASAISRWVEFWFLYLAFRAWNYYTDYQKQQLELVNIKNELSNAKLSALKAQLQPHFLFNTLNTISSLTDENPALGQKVISKLGKLLRTILDQEAGNLISLSEEMEYIRSYLDIEQVRFLDRLSIEYQLNQDTLSAKVPQLILQPLVENAIKHGFAQNADEGKIVVSSHLEEDTLCLKIRDNGKGVANTQSLLNTRRIGLKNVKERLIQVYGNQSDISFQSEPNNYFEVTITMPFWI